MADETPQPDREINETNFREVAKGAIEKYHRERMLLDALFWDRVVSLYESALGAPKPSEMHPREHPDLMVDPKRTRIRPDAWSTLPVRAKTPEGRWGTFDVSALTRESLLDWLDGRDTRYHKSVILALLGHDHVL